MKAIAERLRRGKLAYTTKASTIYEGPTLQDTEAATTIDALVAALEEARNDLRGHGFNVDDLDAALALARGGK
jgi:hypothetical protein